MGCSGCSTKKGNDTGGCGKSCGCSSGGCNKLNTFDWLTAYGVTDVDPYTVVEVSFKNGARKGFYRNPIHQETTTGDHVLVETTSGGFDIGQISLSGELVRLQMKKKTTKEDSVTLEVIRRANDRDLERLEEGRNMERDTMIRARSIARSLKLDMKIGDVEYQGDLRKATFYYTADGRVDFRELIKMFARDFKVKVEMRQIGARQESALIGGMGACGRELCCSTWLSDFQSVSTAAARYQNLAINQAKLSGQCGRLKCCLNYELDMYIEAVEKLPERADKLKTEEGIASLLKIDIFKNLMYYIYNQGEQRGKVYALDPVQVRSIQKMNQKGEFPPNLADLQVIIPAKTTAVDDDDLDFVEDAIGAIELPPDKRKKKKRKKKGRPDQANEGEARTAQPGTRPERGPRPERSEAREPGKPRPERGPRPERPEARDQGKPRPERGPRPERPEARDQGKPRPERGPRPERSDANRPDNRPPSQASDDRQQRPPRQPNDPKMSQQNEPANDSRNEGQKPDTENRNPRNRNKNRRNKNRGTGGQQAPKTE